MMNYSHLVRCTFGLLLIGITTACGGQKKNSHSPKQTSTPNTTTPYPIKGNERIINRITQPGETVPDHVET